jgi:hypothetical protein
MTGKVPLASRELPTRLIPSPDDIASGRAILLLPDGATFNVLNVIVSSVSTDVLIRGTLMMPRPWRPGSVLRQSDALRPREVWSDDTGNSEFEARARLGSLPHRHPIDWTFGDVISCAMVVVFELDGGVSSERLARLARRGDVRFVPEVGVMHSFVLFQEEK